jgi:hypothetical protein
VTREPVSRFHAALLLSLELIFRQALEYTDAEQFVSFYEWCLKDPVMGQPICIYDPEKIS